jgi:hypothetical protein
MKDYAPYNHLGICGVIHGDTLLSDAYIAISVLMESEMDELILVKGSRSSKSMTPKTKMRHHACGLSNDPLG